MPIRHIHAHSGIWCSSEGFRLQGPRLCLVAILRAVSRILRLTVNDCSLSHRNCSGISRPGETHQTVAQGCSSEDACAVSHTLLSCSPCCLERAKEPVSFVTCTSSDSRTHRGQRVIDLNCLLFIRSSPVSTGNVLLHVG